MINELQQSLNWLLLPYVQSILLEQIASYHWPINVRFIWWSWILGISERSIQGHQGSNVPFCMSLPVVRWAGPVFLPLSWITQMLYKAHFQCFPFLGRSLWGNHKERGRKKTELGWHEVARYSKRQTADYLYAKGNKHLCPWDAQPRQLRLHVPGWPVRVFPKLCRSPPGHQSSARPGRAGPGGRPRRWETRRQGVGIAGHRGNCRTAACKDKTLAWVRGKASWLQNIVIP